MKRRAALVIAPFLVGTACLAGRTPRSDAPSAAPDIGADRVVDLFGINEAVAIPSSHLRRLPRQAQDAAIETRILAVRELGVRHVRVHSAHFPFLNEWAQREEPLFDSERTDAFVVRLLDAGLEPLLMVGPWPGNGPGAVTADYVPDDLARYEAWVRRTVERYDGDGEGDAPGLSRGVRVWEVDNEPDLHFHRAPREGAVPGYEVGKFGSPAEYARVATLTASAIRAADPSARVLPAGLWAPGNPTFLGYAEELWGISEFRGAFVDSNAHGYPQHDVSGLWRGVDVLVDAAPGHAVWVTETSIGSPEDERSQAVNLASIYLEALRRGVVRVYWHSLQEAPDSARRPGGHGGMPGHHLLRPMEERSEAVADTTKPRWKLAAWVIHSLIARFGDLPRSSVTAVEAVGGHALRIGDDIVVFTTVPGPAQVAIELPPGDWERAPIVPDRVDTEPHWAIDELQGGGRVTVDVGAGPVRLSPKR